MKLPSSFFLLLSIMLALSGNTPAADSNLATTETDPEITAPSQDAKQQLLIWNLKTTVHAYEQVGHTNLLWDKPAKTALTEFSKILARVSNSNKASLKIISANSAEAIKAGCDDLMVRYLYARFSTNLPDSEQSRAAEFSKITKEINGSPYPSIRKFYCAARALSHVNHVQTNEALATQIRGEMIPILINNLKATLYDKSTPPIEAYTIANQTLILMENNKINYSFAYGWIQPLFDNWPDEYTTWLLKGKANVHLAWDARGGDWADKVSDEGWRVFFQRLAIANEALEHAWILNPRDPEIAHLMMTVMLGKGENRNQMERWFNRAMALNPNDDVACRSKLYYLEPKWYGSDSDQIAFGKECAQSPKWGGTVPLILVDAHVHINDRIEKSKQAAYWKQPEVWADIQASFNRFFELNPTATNKFRNYALYAYRAEQWKKLNELIPKLGSKDYQVFGGKTEYDRMVQMAKDHATQ